MGIPIAETIEKLKNGIQNVYVVAKDLERIETS